MSLSGSSAAREGVEGKDGVVKAAPGQLSQPGPYYADRLRQSVVQFIKCVIFFLCCVAVYSFQPLFLFSLHYKQISHL